MKIYYLWIADSSECWQAVGMLFKRGSTISAAEGGCQAEVGGWTYCYFNLIFNNMMPMMLVACSMASAGFAACMGGRQFFWIWDP